MKESIYKEDIYVGYRYYHSFDEENILLPFGYGLSYTNFSFKLQKVEQEGKFFTVNFKVKNSGNVSGKQTLLLYLEKPNKNIITPKYTLVGFYKTNQLIPNEVAQVSLKIDLSLSASFDEEGNVLKDYFLYEKGNTNFI